MSKAENLFMVIGKRRGDEMQSALMLAAKYVTADCKMCPLYGDENCAKEVMPPAGDPEKDPTICHDWIFLHFINKSKGGGIGG